MLRYLKFLPVLIISLMWSSAADATGPRVTTSLFTANQNEVHTIDFPPFVSSEVIEGGVASELVRTALSRGNIDADITIHPLRGMIRYYMIQEQAMAMLIRHESDMSDIKQNLISVPLLKIKEGFYYYKPSHPQGVAWHKDFKSLKGFTYGAHYGEDVSAFEQAGIQVTFGRTMALMKQLVLGKIDFLKAPAPTIEWLSKKYLGNEAKDFERIDGAIFEDTLRVFFNRKHAEAAKAAKQFAAALESMKKDGTYEEIVNRHLETTNKEGKPYLRRLDAVK